MRNPAKVIRFEYAGVRRLTLGASMYTGACIPAMRASIRLV
jgi:hypothetical protein